MYAPPGSRSCSNLCVQFGFLHRQATDHLQKFFPHLCLKFQQVAFRLNRFPCSQPVFILPPSQIELVFEKRRNARAGRRLPQNLKRILRWDILPTCGGGQAGQRHHNKQSVWRHNLHLPNTFSEPIAYQPPSSRPSFAKRMAGFFVRGSSIAIRTS
jgi:hypothetical protein